MPYLTITPMLEKWFGKSLAKLPHELRAIATFHIPRWADLSAGERRNRAGEIDRQQSTKFRIKREQENRARERARNDPQQQREQIIHWYDETLNAGLFWKMPDIDPKDAATILCGHNPLDSDTNPEATTTEDGQTTPGDYRRLLTFFQSVAATDKQSRTLAQWRAIAREYGLKYHSWIDEYALTMPNEDGDEAAAAPTVSDGVTAKESPAERRAKLDITGERGCRRRILENWDNIESSYGSNADGRQVLRFLKQTENEAQPVLKTVQNHLAKLRQEKLIP